MPAMRVDLTVSLFLLAATTTTFSSACNQISPCECHFSDGTSINLVRLFAEHGNSTPPYLQASKDNIILFYHGCVDFKFQLNYNNINEDKCRNAATMCTFNATQRDIREVAVALDGHFTTYNEDKYIALSYAHFNESRVNVVLVCTPDFDDNVLELHSIAPDGGQLDLHLFSKHACRTPVQPSSSLSIGTKLLIIVTSCTLVYLIGGMCFARYVRGAQGHELVPNVDFWRALPGLVKDGVLFIVGGCNPHLLLSTDTYNQI